VTLQVLLIDDDARLRALLSEFLGKNDVRCVEAQDGEAGLLRLKQEAFDAVILDVMMPGMDGLSVLRELRQRSSAAVIMLTAKGDETDRVVGLELGADDYMAKPFSPRELLARIRAVLRRGQPNSGASWLRSADVELNCDSREVRAFGAAVELTAIEFDLLRCLLERKGRVLSRERLWSLSGRDDTVVSNRAVDVHISHLRKKLRDQERNPQLIQTVRGVGYVLGAQN
jgi:DNA-binding response OmpR family regulator